MFDKLDTVKMRGLDTSNVSCRVETCRDEPSGIWAYSLTYFVMVMNVGYRGTEHL